MIEQHNKSMRSVLAALTVGALTTLSVKELNQLINRYSSHPKDKIKALDILDKHKHSPNIDKKIDNLKSVVRNKNAILVFPKKHPNKAENYSDRLSDSLLSFIKRYEGFHPKRYWDYKQWSIGYGLKAMPSEKTITQTEADRRLRKELERRKKIVVSFSKKHNYNWSENQLNAMISFHYNIGDLKSLTQNGKRSNSEIAKHILLYNKAGGKVLDGLIARRNAEHRLFTLDQNDRLLAKN